MNASNENLMVEYVGEDIPYHSRIIFILVGVIYVIVGVVGNLVIIVTIATTKSMHTPHYCFIANLAMADILITGYVLPWLVLSLILRHYPVVDFNHCVFNGFLTVWVYVASLVSLLAISINRYLNVCHYGLFRRIFARNYLSSLVGCGLIWLVSFLCTLPCVTGWGRFVFDRKVHYCGYDRTYSFSYTLFLLLFSIGVPVVIVFCCNFAIWRFVRQTSHRIYALTRANVTAPSTMNPGHSERQDLNSSGLHDQSVVGAGANTRRCNIAATTTSKVKVAVIEIGHVKTKSNNSNSKLAASKSHHQESIQRLRAGAEEENRNDEIRDSVSNDKIHRKPPGPLVTPDELALVKTVFTVFLCFAALMSPYMISTLLDTEDQWSPVLHLSCSFTSFTNSCLNCILYGTMTPRFRKAFSSLFHRVWRRAPIMSSSGRNQDTSARGIVQGGTL